MNNKDLVTNSTLHNLYLNYLAEWIPDHSDPKFAGMSPVCFKEWVENELEDFDKEELSDYLKDHIFFSRFS